MSCSRHLPTLRRVPPAAGFPSPKAISSASASFSQTSLADIKAQSARFFAERFFADTVIFAPSGTAALELLFRALRISRGRDRVVLSAFTCPEIAVAAARAGCKLIVADVLPSSLSLDVQSITETENVAALVLSNLYGLPESLAAPRAWAAQHGAVLVDDACQGARSQRGNVPVGGEVDTVGVLSFGRGKAYCALGGGALFLRQSVVGEEIAAPQIHHTAFETMALSLKAHALFVLQRPAFYGLIHLLPSTGLGETRCELQYAEPKLHSAQLAAALAATQEVESENTAALQNVDWYHTHLRRFSLGSIYERTQALFPDSVRPIRYPVMLPCRETKESAIRELGKFGVSASYPRVIDDFPELRGYILSASSTEARKIVDRLVTLPVHSWVTESDRAHIMHWIEKHCVAES